MNLSILGFGCGAVGGLMVRGSSADQDRAFGMAVDAGINYFDTAVQYGNGASETNLGRILAARKSARVHVGTKVRIPSASFGAIAATVSASIDASLKRLGLDCVDIFHLHNPITVSGGGETLSADQVMHDVLPAFQALRQAGKTRFLGITAVGDTPAVLKVIDSGEFNSAQVSYNMLNPSAAKDLPRGYPAQDYGRMFDHTQKAGVGVVGIRVLAAGALSASAKRHPTASPPPEPIGSGHSYETDLQRAQRLLPLVQEGFAGSLTEAAIRFAISHPAMGSILVGMATVEEFQHSLDSVLKGPLPDAALKRVAELAAGFAGETR
ncbi:MAG TPA: aldo/keto reductase [Rhodopila sp.]|uniref:aldo/keto reductase n=1 Tax=Rhodopila sp. TaxID=2480087 RepID=UPI002C7FE3FA|nr:aldo/keto reductase [Rhodopila sp.]HVY18215.1 aldo/keto reductase [Rhodopila sp.]